MPRQQYKNHIRYYVPHHFIFYPVITVLLAVCIKEYFNDDANSGLWLMMAAIIFMVAALSFMLRQHYALNNQNRIVRLEMRLRYYQLTQQRFDAIEQQLSFNQLAALRFAGDDELIALTEQTLRDKLTPDAIKQLITHWQEDHMRV
jgi:Family of unknown function (DUF6526)